MTIGLTWRRTARRIKRLKQTVLAISPDYLESPDPRLFGALGNEAQAPPREPARMMIAIGSQERWHLQLAQRWIVQYNFYINDRNWGRMFVRICPYLPFSARVCLNQHHWLAKHLGSEGIDFEQCPNAFLNCSHPQKLQELADSLTGRSTSV